MINLKSTATPQEINAIAAMTNDARADLANRINATEPFTIFDLVEGKDDEIICPFCGSGSHGNHNTGIKPSFENGVWLFHCFAGDDCEGTLLNIIAQANNLSTRGKDFFEVLAIAANITNQNFILPADEKPVTKKATSEKKFMEQKIKQPVKEFERLADAKKNLPSFVKNQGGKWRGLSLETLQRLNCGVLSNVYFPEVKKKLPAVVIPNDLNGVYFRSIQGKFHKNNKPMATTTVFLPNTDSFDLFITEGQINALSIFQAVQYVTNDLPEFGIIACSGTSGKKVIIDKLQQLQADGKKIRVILAFDNDTSNAGQNAANKILDTLIKAGYQACSIDITKTPDIDCNDVLQQDDGDFKLFNLIEAALAQVVFDNRKARVLESVLKEKTTSNPAGNSVSSILSARKKEVNSERTDFNMGTDTKFIPATFTDLISSKEAAKLLEVSASTLEKWRNRKLFGCPFFTADVKKGGSWYYSRERVEQLKAVYQKGVLQNMYKLAARYEYPEVFSDDFQKSATNRQPVDDFQNWDSFTPNEIDFEILLPESEVSTILEVTKQALHKWRKTGYFVEDLIDHDGIYCYSKKRVEELKKRRTNNDKVSDSNLHEVNSSDINGETDSFEIEKNRVLSDAFNDSETQKFFIPLPYVVTNHGVKKFSKKDVSTICPRPILIKDKFFNLDDKTFKLSLEHLNANKQWKAIPPQPRANIFNKNKIVELSNFGLPVTTGNSAKIVEWLFNFDLANENFVPLTYTVNRCGWFTFKEHDYFIDPRRENFVLEDGKKINIIVDSASQTATSLKTKGSLEKWKEAYNLAADSVVARATVAAAVAAPLLKILNERNFVFYTHGKTRGGKSTALYLAASAVGNKDLVRVFDGTNNGLTAMAAETNDYPFFVDEKQAADTKLKNDFQRWIYSDANGTERARANKDGTAKPARTWQHITICNGETELLDDTATGGAHTRLLQIAAPNEILDPETCKKIRDIIKDNYGYALPLFIAQLQKENFEELQQRYEDFQKLFYSYAEDNGGKILPEYAKYIALIFIADQIFNDAIGNDIGGLEWRKLLKFVPTLEDIDDAKKEFNSVLGFIAEKAAHFVGSEFYNRDRGLDIYGKSQVNDDFTLLTVSALKLHCKDKSLDYEKVVSDGISRGYFIPDDKIRDSRMTKPSNFVQKKISGIKYNVFQIPNKFIFGDNE